MTRYHLTIEAEHRADDPQGVRRLRLALKPMLRRLGLRCVKAEPIAVTAAEAERLAIQENNQWR
jgi:hypothetical protein